MKKIFTLIIMCVCALGVTAQNRSFPYTVVGVLDSVTGIYKNGKLVQNSKTYDYVPFGLVWLTFYENKIVDNIEKISYELAESHPNGGIYQSTKATYDSQLGAVHSILMVGNPNSVTNLMIAYVLNAPESGIHTLSNIHHMDVADFNALVNQCNLGGGVSVGDSSRYIPSDNPARQMLEKNKSYWQDNYGYKDCHICYGSGTCQTCNGDGWYHSMGSTLRCPNCQHGKTGKCGICGGTGKVYRRK